MIPIHHCPGARRASPRRSSTVNSRHMVFSKPIRKLITGVLIPPIGHMSATIIPHRQRLQRQQTPSPRSGALTTGFRRRGERLQTARLEHKVARRVDMAVVPVHVARPDKGITNGRAIVRLSRLLAEVSRGGSGVGAELGVRCGSGHV